MGIVVDQVLFESFNLAELQLSVAESPLFLKCNIRNFGSDIRHST